jgi:hypothetical protein
MILEFKDDHKRSQDIENILSSIQIYYLSSRQDRKFLIWVLGMIRWKILTVATKYWSRRNLCSGLSFLKIMYVWKGQGAELIPSEFLYQASLNLHTVIIKVLIIIFLMFRTLPTNSKDQPHLKTGSGVPGHGTPPASLLHTWKLIALLTIATFWNLSRF